MANACSPTEYISMPVRSDDASNSAPGGISKTCNNFPHKRLLDSCFHRDRERRIEHMGVFWQVPNTNNINVFAERNSKTMKVNKEMLPHFQINQKKHDKNECDHNLMMSPTKNQTITLIIEGND
jgi:hypothetical protein